MGENIYHIIGFLAGMLSTLLIVLAIRWVIQKRTHSTDKLYDERQLLARGRAAQYGFFVCIFYMLIVGICSEDSRMYFGACLGLAVFGCTCIIRDAYFPVSGQSAARIALTISVVVLAAIWNLILGIQYPENNASLLNLLLGIMLVVILLVIVGKLIYDKKKEDDHEA